jgi:plasmid maintenance system antidote protein VapI
MGINFGLMKNTQTLRALIRNRLRNASLPKIRQSDIAEKMGYGKAWVSKLMNGTLQSITDDQADKLEEILGIKIEVYRDKAAPTSQLGADIELKMKENPLLAQAFQAILVLVEEPVITSPKFIETKDMTRVGQEIIRIAFANEDKPGKVARLVLELLS